MSHVFRDFTDDSSRRRSPSFPRATNPRLLRRRRRAGRNGFSWAICATPTGKSSRDTERRVPHSRTDDYVIAGETSVCNTPCTSGREIQVRARARMYTGTCVCVRKSSGHPSVCRVLQPLLLPPSLACVCIRVAYVNVRVCRFDWFTSATGQQLTSSCR